MPAPQYLSNQLLIAMPTLADSHFSQTVTLICEHTEQGALGIIINRPMKMRMAEVLEQLDLSSTDDLLNDQAILRGGPVQTDRGFVIHRAGPLWNSTLVVSEHIHVTTSRDILQSIAEGRGPSPLNMALGYAGWGPGQLDSEIQQNAWLSAPADMGVIFDAEHATKWKRALHVLRVDPLMLSGIAGRA